MMSDPIARLTEQQRLCLRMVYAHMTSKEIAPRLGIEPNSVDQHIKAAMRTLGVSDRRSAARILAEQENRPAELEMREAQAPFQVAGRPQTLAGTLKRLRSTWPGRFLLAAIILAAALLVVGIVISAVEALLRLFGF